MTPGKLRGLVKDLWQNSPVTFRLADGTPLRVAATKKEQPTEEREGVDRPAGPPGLTIWLEPCGLPDVPPPAQTVGMSMNGYAAIDDVPGTGD